MLKVQCSALPLSQVACDVLIVMSVEGEMPQISWPNALQEAVDSAVSAGDYHGRADQSAVFYTGGALQARKLMLQGLGKASGLTVRKLRRLAAAAARTARRGGARTLAFAVEPIGTFSDTQVASCIADGVGQGLYRFESLKSDQKELAVVENLILVGNGPEIEAATLEGRILADAVNTARHLNWLPGNYLTATEMARRVQEMCGGIGIEIDVYDRQGCRDLGLHLLLAVNQGSVEEPRFIVMRYKGNGGNGPWLGIVGKGVTFDTGGISLKPFENMWDMKYDMSGAGAVVGAVQAIAQLGLKCDVMAIIAATDNMPDGGAFKPGDVIRGLSGKSVEIRSTDAEGRLVLADGLAYAVLQGCKKLLTISTLTGSAHLSLGPVRFGIVSNNSEWEEVVFQSSEEMGEPGWKLPTDEEYHEFFASPIADMTNHASGRTAGTIIGGMFLLKHVSDIPCVHMDIAAVAFRGTDDRFQDPGATGVGVRTLVQVATRFAEENG